MKTNHKQFNFSFSFLGLVAGLIVFVVFLHISTFEAFSTLLQAKFPTQNAQSIAIAAESMQKAFALLALMIIWWLTEAVPIPVTALMPAVLIPFLDIQKLTESGLKKVNSVDILANYADPIVFLFLGGFILASAMTYHQLDKRITFKLLSYPIFTKSPERLLLGIMLATAFISMWINNTAVAAMLMPIGVGMASSIGSLSGENQNAKAVRNFAACIAISIAYSASIGGIATIVGSTPNGIAVSMLKQQNLADMTFVSWLSYGVPAMFLILLFAYFYLCKTLPFKEISFHTIDEKVKMELQKLGKMTSGEQRTLYVFLMTAFCWLFLPFLKGVFPPFLDKIVTAMDTWVVAMLSALALFFISVGKTEKLSVGTQTTAMGTQTTVENNQTSVKNKRLISWEHAQKSVDWGALILFGGGLALSKILFETKSIVFVAEQITSLLGEPSLLVYVLVMTFFVNFLTEVSSNTAVASMMTPIAISMAASAGFSPIPLCIAIAFGASMAFMLPIATPPNAIAYGTGLFKLKDMVRVGFVLNLVSTLIITLVIMLNQ